VHASSLREAARRKTLDNNDIQDRAGGKSDQWSKDLGDAIIPQAGRAGKGCFWMERLIKTVCQLSGRSALLVHGSILSERSARRICSKLDEKDRQPESIEFGSG
jgi:hypothetical protein